MLPAARPGWGWEGRVPPKGRVGRAGQVSSSRRQGWDLAFEDQGQDGVWGGRAGLGVSLNTPEQPQPPLCHGDGARLGLVIRAGCC